jgi:hypothetical protein
VSCPGGSGQQPGRTPQSNWAASAAAMPRQGDPRFRSEPDFKERQVRERPDDTAVLHQQRRDRPPPVALQLLRGPLPRPQHAREHQPPSTLLVAVTTNTAAVATGSRRNRTAAHRTPAPASTSRGCGRSAWVFQPRATASHPLSVNCPTISRSGKITAHTSAAYLGANIPQAPPRRIPAASQQPAVVRAGPPPHRRLRPAGLRPVGDHRRRAHRHQPVR